MEEDTWRKKRHREQNHGKGVQRWVDLLRKTRNRQRHKEMRRGRTNRGEHFEKPIINRSKPFQVVAMRARQTHRNWKPNEMG